ncbi:hypothetical protein NX059_011143 [Plenodomus lindquistii]|nr:hypothetical protein NX059_011143 [Plenodomus lindquistii]
MATFHPFTRLPAELRLMVWELTIEPRQIKIRKVDESAPNAPPGSRLSAPRLVCTAPIPAIAQVHRESRYLGLYRKSLLELGFRDGAEPWYIWADLRIDTLNMDVGETPLAMFKPFAASITHFQIVRKVSSGAYYWGSRGEDGVWRRSTHINELLDFPDLKEIFILNTDDARGWHSDCGRIPVQSIFKVIDEED